MIIIFDKLFCKLYIIENGLKVFDIRQKADWIIGNEIYDLSNNIIAGLVPPPNTTNSKLIRLSQDENFGYYTDTFYAYTLDLKTKNAWTTTNQYNLSEHIIGKFFYSSL